MLHLIFLVPAVSSADLIEVHIFTSYGGDCNNQLQEIQMLVCGRVHFIFTDSDLFVVLTVITDYFLIMGIPPALR